MKELYISKKQEILNKIGSGIGQFFLFSVASTSAIAVLFIFYFITKDALPFFQAEGITEFFTSTNWYPSQDEAEFGAFSIFYGTVIVTLGAIIVAIPLGIIASVCLSDILPFTVRQYVKPVIEILAAIPSVAYGFFALVIFAPMLQNNGGELLSWTLWVVGIPFAILTTIVASDILSDKFNEKNADKIRFIFMLIFAGITGTLLFYFTGQLSTLQISSGTNAFNVSIILGIMALPTIVSVSEDALQSTGRDLREGSYALGATRAETITKVIIPAAISGILAGCILGVMRAVGETMVVWMASGNAAQVPTPFYNLMEPVRTLTATIAGDMGEADHVTGSSRFHVLFAMAFSLLAFSFIMNIVTEFIVNRFKKKNGV